MVKKKCNLYRVEFIGRDIEQSEHPFDTFDYLVRAKNRSKAISKTRKLAMKIAGKRVIIQHARKDCSPLALMEMKKLMRMRRRKRRI